MKIQDFTGLWGLHLAELARLDLELAKAREDLDVLQGDRDLAIKRISDLSEELGKERAARKQISSELERVGVVVFSHNATGEAWLHNKEAARLEEWRTIHMGDIASATNEAQRATAELREMEVEVELLTTKLADTRRSVLMEVRERLSNSGFRGGALDVVDAMRDTRFEKEEDMRKSVGEDYPREQARCREALESYRQIGPPGAFAAAMIEQTLQEADAAMASGDIVRIVRAYKAMTEVKE